MEVLGAYTQPGPLVWSTRQPCPGPATPGDPDCGWALGLGALGMGMGCTSSTAPRSCIVVQAPPSKARGQTCIAARSPQFVCTLSL